MSAEAERREAGGGSTPAEEIGVRAAWLIVLFALTIGVAIRVRLLDVPFERDEGEYAYGGQLLLDGVPPFHLHYNMKLPGAQIAYALSMAVFGETISGARLGLILTNIATTLLLFGIGRRLIGNLAGAGAAVAFVFLSLGTELLGLFGHATHFVALAAVVGLWLFLRALEGGSTFWYAVSGLAFGIAVSMKQPGLIFPAFALCVLLASRLSKRPREPRRMLREALALIAGVAAPIIGIGAWLATAGVFSEFRFWVLDYSAAYATALGVREGLDYLRATTAGLLRDAPLIWALAGIGFWHSFKAVFEPTRRGFVAALAVFSAAGVCPGLYFRGHYFLLALPAAALLAGSALQAISDLMARKSRAKAGTLLAATALALACAQSLWVQRAVLFRLSREDVSRAIYGYNPFPESIEIGRHLREQTSEQDRIVVFGSEPQIYFYSGRRSVSGYIYMYPLMERHALARGMQERLIRDVESAWPAYLVWVRVPTSWQESRYSEQLLFEWARNRLPARYEIAGEVTIRAEATEYRWYERSGRPPTDSSAEILVLRRRDFVQTVPVPAPPD